MAWGGWRTGCSSIIIHTGANQAREEGEEAKREDWVNLLKLVYMTQRARHTRADGGCTAACSAQHSGACLDAVSVDGLSAQIERIRVDCAG